MTAWNGVPAARGTVKVEKDKNGNAKLDIKVDHLASPASLTPPGSVYIVWVLPNGATSAVRQGAIRVDKNLKGELKVVTPAKDFELFITAENSEIVSAPSAIKILDTHITVD